VVVPGSVANLGGGFDTLGVAVDVYLHARIVEVRDDGGTRLEVVRSTPPVRGRNAVERAFDAIARRTGRRTPTVLVEVDSEIPMAAGLGSSAAATVAGIRLFERFAGPLTDGEMLAAATEAEGHADNAAPALFGGLNSVLQIEGSDPIALRWTWPQDLQLVVATPSVGLATAKARAALAPVISRADAIFNLQRVLSLVHALQSGDVDRLREAVRDRWHQPARAALVPLLEDSLAVEDSGVLGVFLSGAGPSIAWLVRRDTQQVARVAHLVESMYQRAGITATVRTLNVHETLSQEASQEASREAQSKDVGAAAPTRPTPAPPVMAAHGSNA
jgi:homoserine kinase